MSIIHDALKKVQQSLTPKTDKTPAPSSGTTQKGDSYIYATPPPVETIPSQKKPVSDKIKSILALICALAVIAGSVWYLYQQFRYDIPIAQRSAKKSFYQLIHKEEIPDFKNKAPEDLKPLAQIVIPPVPTSTAATTVPSPAPVVTLNIHGIMSNATGNVALINDHVYQEGDEVDGAKIVKINLDSITVDINGIEKTIFVKD